MIRWAVAFLLVVAAARALAAPASQPVVNLPSYGESIRRMLVSLLGIVAALVILAKVLPRFIGTSRFVPRSRVMQVVEVFRLEPRKTLYLVKVAEQYLLIGAAGDRLTTLGGGELDQQKLAAAVEASARHAERKKEPGKEMTKEGGVGFSEVLRGKVES